MILGLVALAWAGAIDLGALRNADLLADVPGADAVCLRGPGHPEWPVFVDLPVPGPLDGMTITLVQPEGPPAPGVGAVLGWTYADGAVGRVFAASGRQVGPGAVVGRGTESVVVGTRPDGTPQVGTRWTAPTRAAASNVRAARLETRLSTTAPVCVVAAETADGVPLTSATDTHDWYPFTVSSDLRPLPQSSPIEAPAGMHGRLTRTPDGHFAFADGTPVRFWGINLVGAPAIPTKEQADRLAGMLANLGFNLVRLHHIDGTGANGVLNPRRTTDRATWLDPAQTDRLDFFISRLQAHGLYVYAEVATAREFTAQDGVPDPGGMPNGHKLATMWSPAWQQAYLDWFDVFWNRTNPYTGRRYPEDPGVAMVELSNEHSLLMHWGPGLEAQPPAQLRSLDARWNTWLQQRYPSADALRAAWTSGARYDGLPTADPWGAVRREPAMPAAFDFWPMQRRRDLFEFYRTLEQDFYAAVARKARDVGFTVPLVPSIVYDQPMLQYLYRSYDMVDTHIAYDSFNGAQTDNISALHRPETFLSYAATAVAGQPMGVTELNHPFPNPFRAEAPFLWATFLSDQDWDNPMWFSWSDVAWSEDDSSVAGSFDLRSNTVALTQMASASSLFRSRAIPSASGYLPYNVDPDVLTVGYLSDQHVRPQQLRPLSLLDLGSVLTHRVRSSFEHVTPPAVEPGAEPGVGWWSEPGTLLLDQPMVRARVGPPGGALSLGYGIREVAGLDVQLGNWAAVALVSADGQPLDRSARAMLTVATRQENTGMRYGAQGTELVQWGGPPILVEPARGTIGFAWPTRPVVVPLDVHGAEASPLPVARVRGLWTIRLDDVRSPWFIVRNAETE